MPTTVTEDGVYVYRLIEVNLEYIDTAVSMTRHRTMNSYEPLDNVSLSLPFLKILCLRLVRWR